MVVSDDVRPVSGPGAEPEYMPSLRRRMIQAGWLFGGAGIVSFIGFLMVAIGIAQPILLTTSFGLGSAFLDALVPWGIGVIGFGVLLGFFGAAVKGPSMEWRDVGPDAAEQRPPAPRAPGYHYACPGCGGDVYSSQAVCPECGHALTVRSAPSP